MDSALLPQGEGEENNRREWAGGVTTGVKDLCSVTARHNTLLYNLCTFLFYIFKVWINCQYSFIYWRENVGIQVIISSKKNSQEFTFVF